MLKAVAKAATPLNAAKMIVDVRIDLLFSKTRLDISLCACVWSLPSPICACHISIAISSLALLSSQDIAFTMLKPSRDVIL